MNNTHVNLRQRRDFGDVFNASFSFIIQEIKPLTRSLLIYSMPVLILCAVATVFVSIEQQNVTNAMQEDPTEFGNNPLMFMGKIYLNFFINLIFYTFSLSSIRYTVNSYIKLYVTKGKGQFTNADMWNEVRRQILPTILSSALIGLIALVGFILCVVPGVYFGVSLCLVYIIQTNEGLSLGKAFSRSFSLSGKDWWITLGLIVVSYMIVYLVQLLFSIPGILLGLKSLFSAFKSGSEIVPPKYSTTFFIISSATSLLTYLMLTVPVVVLAFQYFNLVEVTERPGLEEQISKIG